jgi:RNA-binding protein
VQGAGPLGLKPAAPKAPAAEPAAPAEPGAPPQLSEKQRRHLRGLAHELKPLVRLGNAGLTDAVTRETARALSDHELIKVKAQAPDRATRDAIFEELARRTGAALVHRIGHIGVLYRPRADGLRILIPD